MSSFDVLGILPEERFECSICEEVFSDPVTTPCGHTFCKACIGELWDSREICQCPKCNKRFHARPEVSTNSLMEEISTQIKRRRVEVKEECVGQELPTNSLIEEISTQMKRRGVEVKEECVGHERPAQKIYQQIYQKICEKHQRKLELYCRDDEMCICLLCTETDHREHQTAPLEEEAPLQKEKNECTRAEIQTMIRERKEKMVEVKFNVELSREKTQKALEECDKLFTALMNQVRGKHTGLKSTVERKQQETENMANAIFEQMEQEIAELQGRSNELEELENNHDHLYLLQTAKKLCTHPTNTGWSERSLYSDVCINTVRGALSNRVHAFSQELKTLTDMELKRMREYKESVTLDADTANRWLTLSEDGKHVKCLTRPNPVTDDNPKRFDCHPMVLGKKGFTSGRHYWEVQVGVRTEWIVGVAMETVNRKGKVNVKREHGIFSMGNRGLECTSNDTYLNPRLRKVGVYLDYEEGRVSFYDVDEKSHIYSLTGETFTEKMFPYFYVYSRNKRSEALLIT